MLRSPASGRNGSPPRQSIAAGSENVNGVIYQVYEIRKAALFASESGTLTIPSLQFELEMADPRSAFFGAQALRRSTQEIKVKVNEPPAAAAGLPVGQFSFALRCPQKKADINEIVTLQMEIRGSGNSKAIIPPTVAGGEQALVYPAKITQENAYSTGALTGTLRAEIPVSFQRAGAVTFPALEFRYFDPARRRRHPAQLPGVHPGQRRKTARRPRPHPAAQRHRPERRGHRFHQGRPAP